MLTLQEMHIYTSVCTPLSIVTCPSCASVLRNRRKAESLVLFNIEFHIEGCLCSWAFNTISFFCLAQQRKGRHKFMEDTFNKTQKPSVWSKIARPLSFLKKKKQKQIKNKISEERKIRKKNIHLLSV